MQTEQPFFAAGLLVTAPDGTYGGIRRHERVAAYGDRLEIGRTKIYYQYLTDLRVYRNVLHVTYAASDGKQVEQFFKYNTFLAKTGAKSLAEMAARATEARKAIVKPSIWQPQQTPVKEPIKAEMLDVTPNGWQRVGVYSAHVAFPATCPVCLRPADAIAAFRMSAGFDEKGSWFQFQYTASAVYLSMMMPSKIYVLRPDQNRFFPGLKYSLLSAVIGWWSIAGLIWTPTVIIRNSRGGIDLTRTVAMVLSGTAISAGGYR